jgi:hypothetical protein
MGHSKKYFWTVCGGGGLFAQIYKNVTGEGSKVKKVKKTYFQCEV